LNSITVYYGDITVIHANSWADKSVTVIGQMTPRDGVTIQ
jgi:hypothetical protein